ncbi:hypothetical protein AB6A40_001177 [Gnathostoma spinigerum]|uniref:Uncharacterized protein n=1 Tax=Gnathostoma spinigerum TaxID=75299 RepID=A0ABD6E3K4_9BILA
MLIVINFMIYCLSLVVSRYGTQAIQVRISPPSDQLINRRGGDNLMVLCSAVDYNAYLSPSDVVVEWYRNTNDKPIGRLGRIMTIAKNKTMAKQLMFIEPKVEDSSLYRCTITTNSGGFAEKTVQISFIEEAQFVSTQKEQHPEEGEDAEIECRVKGHPSLEIFWQFNGTNIIEGGPRGYEFRENNQVLFIPKFESFHDDGEYRCNAAQFSSFITLPIMVTAYVRPTITVFEGPLDGRGYEGDNVTLKCQAVGKPKPEYSWVKKTDFGSSLIRQSDKYSLSEGLLTVHSLLSSDAGTYSCIAANPMDEQQMDLELTVFRKPRIQKMKNFTVASGENVNLECLYSGDGEIAVKWLYQGSEYRGNSGESSDNAESVSYSRVKTFETNHSLVLHIASVGEDDAGEYQCVAENDAGYDHKSSFLAITHAPSITASSQSIVRAFQGARIELFCECTAVPDATWTWTGPHGIVEADGSKIVLDHHLGLTKLKIYAVSKEIYGRYTCSADNGFGRPDERSMEVIEIFSPSQPRDLNCHDHVFPNYGLCVVDGYDMSENRSLPISFILYYTEEDKLNDMFDWEKSARNIIVPFALEFYVRNLNTNTRYAIRVRAANEAGTSSLSAVDHIETTDAWAPAVPSGVKTECDYSCSISWNEPDNHGSPITSYLLSVKEITSEANSKRLYADEGQVIKLKPDYLQVDLPLLKPFTRYELKLSAQNEVGLSDAAEKLITTAALSGDTIGLTASTYPKIILSTIITLLLVLILFDVICFVKNRCGLLACICVNCFGQHILSMSSKDVEQSNKSESNRLLTDAQSTEITTQKNAEKQLISSPGSGPHSTSV